jgi:hypothetical protein
MATLVAVLLVAVSLVFLAIVIDATRPRNKRGTPPNQATETERHPVADQNKPEPLRLGDGNRKSL